MRTTTANLVWPQWIIKDRKIIDPRNIKMVLTAETFINASIEKVWDLGTKGVGAVIIALATVSYHGIKATRINPARSLQAE